MKHLLQIKGLSKDDINKIIDKATEMKKIVLSGKKRDDRFVGKSMVTLFYENSTRTMNSFTFAGQFLGMTVANINSSVSSVQKGESLIDTARTIDAYNTDVIVLRHSYSGASKLLAENVNAHIINAGDGLHAHPTQALLDLYTLVEHYGDLSGKKVAIVGDILHSRVARSNIESLTLMGAKVYLFGPKTLMPIETPNRENVVFCNTLNEALEDADAVMGLRIQLERQKTGLFPSLKEYAKIYGLNSERMKLAKENAILMHPGPVNRGVEISAELMDSECSVIEKQVLNGLCVRMAVLDLMLGEN